MGTTPTEDFLLSPEAERVKTNMLLQQARAVLCIRKEEEVYDSKNSETSVEGTKTQATQTM